MEDTTNETATNNNQDETMTDQTPAPAADEQENENTNAEEKSENKIGEESEKQAEDANKNGGDETNMNGSTAATTTTDSDHPKLFVGRLPFGTKDSQLKQLFSAYGEVTHCDIVGKYGFVHMKVQEEANEAMEKLNNYCFNGSNLSVQLSTSTAKRTKRKPNKGNKKGLKSGTTSNHSNNNNNKMKMNNSPALNSNNNNRRINNRFDKFRSPRTRPFNRPMNGPPMHTMSPNMNYFQPPPQPFMNNGPYYPPHPQSIPPNPPMHNPGGPSRDMYYNRPPDGYGYRSNGQAPPPQPMYGPQPPAQNYNQYNNRGMGQVPMNPQANNYRSPMYPPGAGPSGGVQPPPPPMNVGLGYGPQAPPMQNSYAMNTNKYGYY